MYRKGIHGPSTVLFWTELRDLARLFDSFVPSRSMIEGTTSIDKLNKHWHLFQCNIRIARALDVDFFP